MISVETRERMRLARLGKKHSPEAREKISAALRVRPVLETTRAKLSKAMQGNQYCLGKKNALGWHPTEEQRSRMRERMLGNTFALGYTKTATECTEISRRLMGHSVSEETREKIRIKAKSRIHSEAENERLRNLNLHPVFTAETRRKISETSRGRVKSPEARAKLSQSLTGKPLSLEHCAKIGRVKKQSWQDPEWRDKVVLSQIIGRKEAMKRDPTWRARQIEAQRKGYSLFPNKAETVLLNLLAQDYPNEWAYVGNGSLVIGNWNPDFANVNGHKELIELFGDHWHKGQNPQDRIDLFKQFGFRTLVVWERELKQPDKVRERIAEFVKGR